MLTPSLLVVFGAGAFGPIEVKPIVGTFRYDPVELVRTGKPVVGAYSITRDHYAYRYLFTSEENRREFVAHPDLYEIQLGGGCGKMGSLSGRGSPDRFAVFEGKIYVFASDGCRKTFLADPSNFVEKDDEAPKGTAEEARAGRALIAKAVAWAGGASRWRNLKSLQVETRENVKSGDTDYDHRMTWDLEWPLRTRRTDRWNAIAYSDLYDGNQGYFLGSTEATPMDPQQIRALQRIRNHMFPSILKAAAEGRDFAAFARGAGPNGGTRVDVYFDRTGAALEVRAESGEIVAIDFRERRQGHGLHRQVFKSFVDLDGLKLPASWSRFFDGKPEAERSAGQTQYRLELSSLAFELPR